MYLVHLHLLKIHLIGENVGEQLISFSSINDFLRQHGKYPPVRNKLYTLFFWSFFYTIVIWSEIYIIDAPLVPQYSFKVSAL